MVRGEIPLQVKGLSSVRFGSKAGVNRFQIDVRITTEGGHSRCKMECPPWAKSEIQKASKRRPDSRRIALPATIVN